MRQVLVLLVLALLCVACVGTTDEVVTVQFPDAGWTTAPAGAGMVMYHRELELPWADADVVFEDEHLTVEPPCDVGRVRVSAPRSLMGIRRPGSETIVRITFGPCPADWTPTETFYWSVTERVP